jgi:hypothetical protein
MNMNMHGSLDSTLAISSIALPMVLGNVHMNNTGDHVRPCNVNNDWLTLTLFQQADPVDKQLANSLSKVGANLTGKIHGLVQSLGDSHLLLPLISMDTMTA